MVSVNSRVLKSPVASVASVASGKYRPSKECWHVQHGITDQTMKSWVHSQAVRLWVDFGPVCP